MKEKKRLPCLFILMFLLTACAPPAPMQDPGLVYTVVAGTQTAAAQLTQIAQGSFTKTPTQAATLRPTITPFPTMTSFVYEVTASATATPTASNTPLPPVLTAWPDWKTGEVVTMPKGSGENIGVNKRFNVLVDVNVLVVRTNGVKLRSVPNKAADGPLEETGSMLTLTGIVNKNNDFGGWLFVQVIAVNGKTYWVGGSEGDGNTDPTNSLVFYYPHLTASPTPSDEEMLTPSPSPYPTLTPFLIPTISPSATATP